MNTSTGAVLGSDDEKGRTRMLAKIADALKSTCVILLFLIIVLMLVVVGVKVVRPTQTIENVVAPEAVQKLGYTPAVLAQKISDATRVIASNSEPDFDLAHPRHFLLSVSAQPIEAKIPGSDFTVQSAAEFISTVLAYPERRITGEITKLDDAFDVTIRQIGEESLSTKVPTKNDRFEPNEIVPIAAQMAMQLAEPYVLPASFFNEGKAKPTDFSKTMGILNYILEKNKNSHKKENLENLYLAHNLKCAAFARLNNIDRAKEECEKAIQLDPTNWPAVANLGSHGEGSLYPVIAECRLCPASRSGPQVSATGARH